MAKWMENIVLLKAILDLCFSFDVVSCLHSFYSSVTVTCFLNLVINDCYDHCYYFSKTEHSL